MATPLPCFFRAYVVHRSAYFHFLRLCPIKVCKFYKIVLSFSNITLVLISAKVIDKLLLRSISISKCKLIII